MKKICNQKGFSLAECMVSVAILTIILGAVLAYLFMTLNTYKQEAENNNVNLDGRTMLAVMTNELRDAYDINFGDSKGNDPQGNERFGKINYKKEIDSTDVEELSASELPWSGGKYQNIILIFTRKYKSNDSDNPYIDSDNPYIDSDNPYIIDIELTLDSSKFTTSVFPLNQEK